MPKVTPELQQARGNLLSALVNLKNEAGTFTTFLPAAARKFVATYLSGDELSSRVSSLTAKELADVTQIVNCMKDIMWTKQNEQIYTLEKSAQQQTEELLTMIRVLNNGSLRSPGLNKALAGTGILAGAAVAGLIIVNTVPSSTIDSMLSMANIDKSALSLVSPPAFIAAAALICLAIVAYLGYSETKGQGAKQILDNSALIDFCVAAKGKSESNYFERRHIEQEMFRKPSYAEYEFVHPEPADIELPDLSHEQPH